MSSPCRRSRRAQCHPSLHAGKPEGPRTELGPSTRRTIHPRLRPPACWTLCFGRSSREDEESPLQLTSNCETRESRQRWLDSAQPLSTRTGTERYRDYCYAALTGCSRDAAAEGRQATSVTGTSGSRKHDNSMPPCARSRDCAGQCRLAARACLVSADAVQHLHLPTALYAGRVVAVALARRIRPSAVVPVLTLASFAFYAYWDVRYVPLLLGSVLFNFLMGTLSADAALVRPRRPYSLSDFSETSVSSVTSSTLASSRRVSTRCWVLSSMC